MRDYLAKLEKIGEEEVFVPLLDQITDKLVFITIIVGGPFFIYLLLQFSFLFF